jgi:hypothetical protein
MHTKALNVLDQDDHTRHRFWHHVQRAYILAELPDGTEKALAAYENALRSELGGGARGVCLTVPLLLGLKAESVQACRELRGRPIKHSHPVQSEEYLETLDYLCGFLSAEELLESAGTSRLRLCEVHFFIGLDRLAVGDRAAAAEHFRRSVGTHAFEYWEYDRSRIFLRRLEEDPTWPPWIPLKEEDAASHPADKPGETRLDHEGAP